MNLGLVEFRKSKNLSQCKMAESIGVSESFYIKIELGLRNPSYNFLQKFKSTFGVEIDRIFFVEDEHAGCK